MKFLTAISVLASSSAKNNSPKRGSGCRRLPSSASSSSLETFGDGFVIVGDDDNHVFGKTSELCGFQIGEICRGGNSTEPVCSPSGDGKLDVVGSEESDTVVVADVPAGLHDIGKTVGTGSNLLKMIAPASVVVDEPWGGVRADGPVGVVIVKEKLCNGHVGGHVWDGAIGGDVFLDGLLRHDDYGWGRLVVRGK